MATLYSRTDQYRIFCAFNLTIDSSGSCTFCESRDSLDSNRSPFIALLKIFGGKALPEWLSID